MFPDPGTFLGAGCEQEALVQATGRVYTWLTDEDDPEATPCESIPDDQCHEVPGNFLKNAANGACTKLAEQLASPESVLPFLLAAIGAPVGLVGTLEPLRRGLATFPQLAVSGRIRGYPVRKRFWVGAGVTQAVVLALVALAATTLTGLVGGIAIVGGLAVFSLASGVGSVAYGDVMGKTIPEGKRGQLLAVRATAGGLFTLLAGVYLRSRDVDQLGVYVALLLAAAVLWAAGAALFASIEEHPGATSGARDPLTEARVGIREIVEVAGFRRYLVARSALLSIELALPFYALVAREEAGTAVLGLLVIAVGVANLVSSPLWGRFGDLVSTRLVMIVAGVIGTSAAGLAWWFDVAGIAEDWAFALVFLIAGIAKAGVRVGRKTYVVDAAPDEERPLYVAASNTVAGGLTLAFAGMGAVAEAAGIDVVLLIIVALGFVGIAASWAMPESEQVRRRAAS